MVVISQVPNVICGYDKRMNAELGETNAECRMMIAE